MIKPYFVIYSLPIGLFMDEIPDCWWVCRCQACQQEFAHLQQVLGYDDHGYATVT